MIDLPTLLAVARGDRPADVRLTNGRVVNVLTEEVEETDLALSGPWIAGIGPGYDALETVDLGGRFVLPGFIDAHVHIESSLATPPEFARAVVPRGTTTVVSDPHEIANVHGLDGIRYMLRASEGLPLTTFVMASSCVPATHMGTAGAVLGARDLASLDHPRVLGLAELMNYPGAIHGAPEVLEKLAAFRGRVVDGHAPGVSGKSLNAYVAAGPRSDHECTTAEEAEEKLRRGLWVFFREATNARNLLALLPALTPGTRRRIALCTDDRQPADLLDKGGIDYMLRTLIAEGVDPIEAIRLATLNPAEYFGLHDRGAIAPGRRADLVVVSALEELRAERVYSGGRLVAEGGTALWPAATGSPAPPAPSMAVREGALDFSIPTARPPGARHPGDSRPDRDGRRSRGPHHSWREGGGRPRPGPSQDRGRRAPHRERARGPRPRHGDRASWGSHRGHGGPRSSQHHRDRGRRPVDAERRAEGRGARGRSGRRRR